MLFHPKPITLDSQTKWEIILSKTLRERGDYLHADEEISYQQIAGVFLGAFEDQEDFEEYLYLLAHEEANGFECLFQGMNREIENKRFQDIQKILNIHGKDSLSLNRFIAFMEGYNLFPFRNEPIYKHYRNNFKQLLELFQKKYTNINNQEFRRVVVDLIKWSWNYLNEWEKSYNFAERMPRILWYGNAKESEVYFLYFLYQFGCDVVVFHPDGENIFSILGENTIPVVKFPINVPLFQFPAQKPNRRSTVAQKASNELNGVLYDESSGMYRAWQFRDYTPQPMTLKTTYDELFILQPEKAMYRQGFIARTPYVEIPNLFSKIVGVTKDRVEYRNRVKKISENHLIHTVTEFPMVKKYKTNIQLHYRSLIQNDKICSDKLINQPFWPYKQLATPLQKGLADVISRFVHQSELNILSHESTEEKRWYLFGQAMLIPEPFIRLFQQFDYSQEVPGILLFNSEGSGTFTREDAALLNLLNEMGFDIFLFNPTGQNDLEQFLDERHYDIHWLEEMSFEEKFPTTIFETRKSKIKMFFEKILN
ncbi:YceG family protein [Viridibacillus arvi]|uniref:YceG family protein n=1 Tax=Viridibacillus arvi TaxID=263475 RepID=UPI0034CE67FA